MLGSPWLRDLGCCGWVMVVFLGQKIGAHYCHYFGGIKGVKAYLMMSQKTFLIGGIRVITQSNVRALLGRSEGSLYLSCFGGDLLGPLQERKRLPQRGITL